MRRLGFLPLALALLLSTLPAPARAAEVTVDPTTGVDHDGNPPIALPEERDKNLHGHQFREAIVEPLSHGFDIPDKLLWLGRQMSGGTTPQSVNVNRFDEVPNSSWFTNRNHVRAVNPASIRSGPGEGLRPTPPFTLKSVKQTGVNPGFTIKDAADRRWVIKLDPPNHPQLGSGADVVVSRLLWAAGFNVPHDVSISFRRQDLKLDEDLVKGADGEPPFGDVDLDTLLSYGAQGADGRSYAQASLFLEGKPIGHIDMRGRRPDDPNDLYVHSDRREMRGLYVLMSWLGSWDTKDHQSLDMFVETKDSLGYVRHHLLDLGGSLGAAAAGPKELPRGYEYRMDWGWMIRRFWTLGFATEPWREAAPQQTGIPSVGNFTAAHFEPNRFKSLMPHPAFRKRTSRDGYWGAKLVASFSDAQVAAAIDAVGYEDPRAKPALLRILLERREAVIRYWFGRVAPVDYFHVDKGTLRFRDLAVDRKIAAPRAYRVRVRATAGKLAAGTAKAGVARETAIGLDTIAAGAEAIELEIGIDGLDSEPTTVALRKSGGAWILDKVVHG